MTTGPAPKCVNCLYYNKADFEKISCKAFPDGIPDEIIFGENNHHVRLPGQENEFVFTPRPKVKK